MSNYEPKAQFTRLDITSWRASDIPAEVRSKLDIAEGWIIASFRCNNDCSDDKAIHYALDALSDHFGWERVKGNVRKRMDAMAERADELGYRGRAVIIGCYALRDADNDDLWGVGGSASIWQLIDDATRLEER